MPKPDHPNTPLPEMVANATTHLGAEIGALTAGAGALLVFLRHAGCPFCREAAADLRTQREAIEGSGVTIILLHQGSESMAAPFFTSFGMEDLHRVADPDRSLFQAMALRRGNLWQIGGPKVWFRVIAAALRGHVPGKTEGDAFQMPGTFLVRDGIVVTAYRHASQADRPRYEAMACSI